VAITELGIIALNGGDIKRKKKPAEAGFSNFIENERESD